MAAIASNTAKPIIEELRKAGGGAMIDLGLPMLDLAWSLLGQPKPLTVFATLPRTTDGETPSAVEEAGFANGRWIARGLLSGAISLRVELPASARPEARTVRRSSVGMELSWRDLMKA